MFVETRILGKKKKYYLVHSYRDKDKVKRITRYLGVDLSEKELARFKPIAEMHIISQIEDATRDVFNFKFSKAQLKKFKEYNDQIKIEHLQSLDWSSFTEEFVYNTNAIEGSHVSFEEVSNILDNKSKVHSDDEKETLSVSDAVHEIRIYHKKLTTEFINKLHLLCFKSTRPFAGKLRTVDVVVKNAKREIVHVGAPIDEINELLENLCKWYEKNKNKLPPLLLAAMIHNEFENIHPYQDGNGRVGRLLLNWVLLQHNYPPINILLSDRFEYYKTLQKFSMKGEIEPTLKFLLKIYKKNYR